MTKVADPLKILFSARDPAAAHAIRNLVTQACRDSRFSVRVVASSPACELLKGLACECLFLPLEVSQDPERLDLVLSGLLEAFSPDAVVAGASGPDSGVDEVLVKQAQNTGIRSYVVQDFWGDVNLTLDAPPDCYLVVDQLAAELTQQRIDCEACIVGSVKHASYGSIDLPLLRDSGRALLGVSKEQPVIGYFGMPLEGLQGYWRTMEALADAVQQLPVKLIYRPHPKENVECRARTRSILSSVEGFYEDFSDCVEQTLAACDLILSCYSSCGIDSELLGRNLPQDERLSIFLLYDSELLEYYRRYTGLDDLPTSLQKRSLTIMDSSLMEQQLEAFLTAESRRDFLETEFCLPPAGQSVQIALDKVFLDCG